MFSIFKSKPKLHELIPNDYCDIHCHVLPGIDDGAKNIEESKYLLESMQALGFKKITATPHTIKTVWDNTTESITNAKNHVYDALPALANELHLQAASEYMIDENFLSIVKNEKLLTIKDNYVLVEMSYLNPPIQLFDILFELQLAGYKPILAHPERYSFYHSKLDQYEKLKKSGCFFQLNLLSTVGYYGKDVAAAADKLLKNDMIDFVGSDIHHMHHIEAFQNKIIIKNTKELENAISKNKIFLK